MQGLKSAKRKILEAKSIVIASHINPDGDSIGSMLALGLGLERLGKEVYMLSQDGVPRRYAALPGARRVRKHLEKKCDLAIAVDCSARELLGENTFKTFMKADSILEIDHHEFRYPFGELILMDITAAAVGEMIYLLLESLGVKPSSAVSQNILTSIIVETSAFRLPGVRPVTFAICSKLVGFIPDYHKLSDLVYWSKTKEAIILGGICLSRSRFIKKGKVVWSIIRRSDLDKVKGKDEDIDYVAGEMLSIKSVKAAVLFRESRDKRMLRVGLRSKGRINVAAVAAHFGGGGHFDCAGCLIPNSTGSLKRFLAYLKSKIG